MLRFTNHGICILTFLLFVTITDTIQAFQIHSTSMQLTPSQVLACSSTTQFLHNPEKSIVSNIDTIQNPNSSSNQSKRNKRKKWKKKSQKNFSLNSQNVGDEISEESNDAGEMKNTAINMTQKDNRDSKFERKKFDNRNKRNIKMSQLNQSESKPPKMVGNAPDIHW